jgi:hypothetical protein
MRQIAMKDFDFRTIHNVLDIIDNEFFETQSFHGVQFFRDLKKRILKAKDCLKKVIFRRYRELGLVLSPPSLFSQSYLSLVVRNSNECHWSSN